MIIRNAPEKLKRAVVAYAGEDVAWWDASIIAGGFLRAFYAGEKPSDMDVYFRAHEALQGYEGLLEKDGWERTFGTERADSWVKGNHKIQTIKMIYGTPEEILEEFDFTVCQCALSGDRVYLAETFFEDLAARVLVFTGSRLPLSSLKRAFKYHRRGYHICDENIVKLAEDIAAAVDFGNEESIRQHTEPMDPNGERSIRLID